MAPEIQQRPRGERPRTCVVSMRGFNRLAAWCSNYEFEDIITDAEGGDLYTLHPAADYNRKSWVVERLYWRAGLRELGARMNPGLQPVTLKHDYDLFFFICGKPSDLIYLNAVTNWKQCKTKICVIVELWTGMIRDYAFHLKVLEHFDHVFLCFSNSAAALQAALGRPCHHLPCAVDVLRFTPYPDPPQRSIDIFSMGRRVDATHAALMRMAAQREIFYMYDTIPGLLVQPRDHREHREMLANAAKRSRMFVTYPAKVGVDNETGGQPEVGARYFEGAACGAALVGKAPNNPVFQRDFGWTDSLIDIGATAEEADRIVHDLLRHPERLEEAGRKNAIAALRGFDWGYRWRQILGVAGVDPLPALTERIGKMNELADQAEAVCAAQSVG